MIEKLPRRKFLQLAAGAATLPVISRVARAQAYPSRPVRLVVGFAPGGASDIIARTIAQWLTQRLRQQFVIDNRPGAGSNIASETVVKAAPDGHTLLLAVTANAVNATLYNKLNFNFARDITPVAGLLRTPLVMLVNPSLPARTVSEFITYAKSNPGKVSMASAGAGTSTHVSGELLKMMTRIEMVHVPYRGDAPALADLLGGQVQLYFSGVAPSVEFIKSGKLRALAVTTAAHSDALPTIPSVADYVPGYEASAWFGIAAPRNTPPEIVDKLNKEINAGLADVKTRSVFTEMAAMLLVGSPADFGRLVAEETDKWGKVIKFAGIKAE